jgi:hypothetical protein
MPQPNVLLIGKSQLVLDDAVAGLRQLGYTAEGTNDFGEVTGRFDVENIDVVVFGGQVPPDRKAALREEIDAINPRVTFVQGLAGIPGLIVNQVRGAIASHGRDPAETPAYRADERMITLTLTHPSDVRVTVWWATSFVPPDPKSDSLVLLEERLPSGDHEFPIPDHVPPNAAFATVQIDAAVHAFSLAAAVAASPATRDEFGSDRRG